jgi:DNA primase
MRDEDQPKYLNSPETPIYRKTHVLYNLHRARDGMRQTNRVVLVEGYMDVIGVYSAGVREVVASCGTALTQQQVRAMKRHADTAIVNFDPDNAGVNAAERAIQILLDENLHVRILALEDGLDPDEYVKRFGAETYRAKLERAAGYFHWLADRARSKFDMSGAEGRMEALRFLLPSIQKIADKIERAAIAGDVAGYLGVEKGLVLDQFKKAATDRQGGVVATAKPTVPSVPELERILLRAVLSNNETRDQLFGRLTEDLTKDFTTREIFSVIRSTEGTFDQVQERLSEPSRDLLHRVLAADDSNVEEEVLLRDAEACLERLIANREKQQLDRLREEVRAAERDGRLREAMELMARMREFQKERRTKTKA